jgi:hypothetical protein
MISNLKINHEGTKFWFVYNYLHRINGPAIIYNDVYASSYWYYNGEFIKCSNQKYFEKFIKLKLLW